MRVPFLGVIGVTGLVRMLLGSRGIGDTSGGESKQQSSGYGNSPYGK